MINRKVVVVDVDLTVVDTATPWVVYMNKLTGLNFNLEEGCEYPYNLTDIYADVIVNSDDRSDLFQYWKSETLYDNLTPLEGSVEALRELDRVGYDIVFASVLKHGHDKSKYYFLKRHFPFMKGCVFTKEKGLIKADVIIDDRNDYLRQFGEGVTKIRMKTPFTQDVCSDGLEVSHWNEVLEVLN